MDTKSVHEVTAHRTSFGMYVPCGRETYRKLKRIRHLAALAEAERWRWDRAQLRQPKNRVFKRLRGGKLVREPVDAGRMIFAPFYELKQAAEEGMPADARLAAETDLSRRFMADYLNARRPVAEPAAVEPATLTRREIDDLLEGIEVWSLKR